MKKLENVRMADVAFEQVHRGGPWKCTKNRLGGGVGDVFTMEKVLEKMATYSNHDGTVFLFVVSAADSPEAQDWAEDRARGRLDD